MRITLAERFQQDVRGLDEFGRVAVLDAMLALPKVLGQPHLHAGLGLRKIHPHGLWEVRVGLGLRLILALAADEAKFVRVGSHDEVRRWLRSL